MSHKATNWLGDIDPNQMTCGAFRVLFHLCDCHNPASGCYPTQAYLAAKSGMARSSVNRALTQLEDAALISRHRSVDARTRKKRPTRYLLAFEKGFDPSRGKSGFDPAEANNPCPKIGHGNEQNPCPKLGHGPVSHLSPEPCPISAQSHVPPVGHKPVREPVKKQRARATEPAKPSQNPIIIKEAERVADRVRSNKPDAFHEAETFVQNHIIAARLLTDQDLQTLGHFAEKKDRA